jgi:Zn finger protein HypA/HybF involved in hydrogenase expression
MAVCHGCGVIAPTKRSTCSLCERPIGTSIEAVPPRADGCVWAFVRTEMKCRQCGQAAPLDEPDVDGTVTCPHCNALQAFDVSTWQDALAHAHALADLAGPDPEGRLPTPGVSIAGRNPYTPIGLDKTFATLSLSGMSIEGGVIRSRNLEVTAAPGQPLCTKCGSPIEVSRAGDTVTTRCVGCGESARYAQDPRLGQHSEALVCVVADALRSDKVEARLDQTSAGMVIALKCPSCGGGLTALEGQHFVDCRFCKTSCRIPSRTLLALKKGKTTPDTWWALFRGPSPKRREIEGGGREGDDDDDDDDDTGSRRRRELEAAAAARARRGGGGLESPPAEPDPTTAAVQLAMHVFIPLVVLAVVSVLFYKTFQNWHQGYLSTEVPPSAGAPALNGSPWNGRGP